MKNITFLLLLGLAVVALVFCDHAKRRRHHSSRVRYQIRRLHRHRRHGNTGSGKTDKNSVTSSDKGFSHVSGKSLPPGTSKASGSPGSSKSSGSPGSSKSSGSPSYGTLLHT